jgi:Protein of unknown function (DUF1554)
MIRARPRALAPGGLLLLGLGLLLPPALVPAEAAAQEDRDAICEGYRGTALWDPCTGAVAAGCAEAASLQCDRLEAAWSSRTGATPPWLLDCGIGSKCVFVTSEVYTADLGGLAGADAKCQAQATAEGSQAAPGTYKAWLSDSTASPGTRFARAETPYQLVEGTTVAAGWTQLTSGTLTARISKDQQGHDLPADNIVWTGTSPTGDSFGRSACSDWTDDTIDTGLVVGTVGHTSFSDNRWTDLGTTACPRISQLYCFQQ